MMIKMVIQNRAVLIDTHIELSTLVIESMCNLMTNDTANACIVHVMRTLQTKIPILKNRSRKIY